ncbi:unnamed protein product [Cyprideis torosa]|uniref:Sulfatase-modifying factor enzyme-like domain-containing protein n=1 Tax=Cyprideis torosa TaxID=163714 RepID=A0A7R8ZVA9_9CRUS|nr:unnamed protein product [Cyprideis torosa]CAG0902303.1 unnamed protein product [Cyprideis torosa]
MICYLPLLWGCKDADKNRTVPDAKDTQAPIKKETAEKPLSPIKDRPKNIPPPEGMVWIPGAVFAQGAVPQDLLAMAHEKPPIKVAVDGFFMDKTEVTNAQFAQFVAETGYVTIAERPIKWEEMKKQLPEGTPKPHDSILQPGALTFKKAKQTLPNLYDFSQWWQWSIGANWKHPNGPGSNIKGKDNFPVVQVSYEDALAYCQWAGRRLPTEAEWELAARGGETGNIFFWGDDKAQLSQMANSWEGEFPVSNSLKDGFERLAPVKSYPPNGYGLYDMAGNVWEWTSDWYNADYYRTIRNSGAVPYNPQGATRPYTPNNPLAKEKVIKGGSFLCSEAYCASYRVSAKMGSSMDSALEHTGFRTVASVAMLQE